MFFDNQITSRRACGKWVGRLVEFRDNLTLAESFKNDHGAKIYIGQITSVYKLGYNSREIYAFVNITHYKELPIGWYKTKPDPKWTRIEYDRKKHHRTKFFIRRNGFKRNNLKKITNVKKFLVELQPNDRRWKPVRNQKLFSSYF